MSLRPTIAKPMAAGMINAPSNQCSINHAIWVPSDTTIYCNLALHFLMMVLTCSWFSSFANVISSLHLCLLASFLLFLFPFLTNSYTIKTLFFINSASHYSLFSTDYFCLSHPFSSPLSPYSWQLTSWAAQGRRLKWSFLYRNWSFIRANRNISQPFIYGFLMSVTNKSRRGALLFPASSWSDLPLASILVISMNHGHF